MANAPNSIETAELMFGCLKRMRRLVDAELGECGLSLSRTKLLSELSRTGPMNQSTLATTFGLAPRTVTELVDTLERDGLVERRPDPADRRARHIHLTAAGEEARGQGTAVKEQLINRLLGVLSDQQRSDLFEALRLVDLELDQIDGDISPAGTGAAGISSSS